ncbi:hypothetical protein ZWY2020_013006 [Hordeum vulgare]|nr:hypothetical protein ZWY2020_013006 [Hordeum vulgare]
MAGVPDESATQTQAQGCSSYPFSFPSQPPDIRNWFASYQYESPEVPELAVDPPGVDNGSEAQDPLEYRVAGHSFLKHAPRDDGGIDLKRGCVGSQAEPADVSARRDILPIGFLDNGDEANESETQVVSAVQRNAVQPLTNCSAVGLPHIEQIHEGASGYSELPADCDAISTGETQENPPAGQVMEHNRLPVYCASTSLAGGTEGGFVEDSIEHTRLPVNSRNKVLADIEKTAIEHLILPVNPNGIGSAVTEESFPGDEIRRSKPKLEHKKTEEVAVADGFVAIRTKKKPAEDRRKNKIPKLSTERENITLQENRCILGTGSTRSPLSDMTNISEVAGAPAQEVSGKWKCPRKGKPYVGPPMKQLRLEQWVRRV